MFILLKWVKYYTKEVTKALKTTSVGAMIILAIVFIKYKPAYAVKVENQELGYVENKEKLELKIKNYIEDTTGNIAFKEQTLTPEYEFKLLARSRETQEKEILLAIEDSAVTTYRIYAVTIDGNVQTTTASEKQAQDMITNLKADVSVPIELNTGIVEQYTTEFQLPSEEEAVQILNNVKIAKISEYNVAQEAERKRQEEEAKKKIIADKTVTSVGTIAGVSLSRPITGKITSRYGSRSAIRSSAHTGLDIATSSGTPIRPIAAGTVSYAGRKGSYGNLVIVNHGNGIESYYAHCSVIYASVGQKVDAHTMISTVGSTVNSTCPNLHLEIRQNGNPLNP